jgi:hypothetical protein
VDSDNFFHDQSPVFCGSYDDGTLIPPFYLIHFWKIFHPEFDFVSVTTANPVISSKMGSVPDVTSDVPSLPASVLHRSEFNDDSEIPAPPAKRARVMAPQNAFFCHAEMDGVSAEKIEDLVGSFMGTCPGLVRATLASLPTDLPVLNSFLVLQITSSRGACTFMQQKRWRLLCREILPCGTRGACSYLTITDFLPVVTTAMPAEFSVRTEWADFKSAPVIVLSGFTQETDKFMNPNWNANLMCGPDSIPRILLGQLIVSYACITLP